METYHKINSIYKRHMDGPKKGKLIKGEWSQPEFEYLANNTWEFTEKVDGTNIRIGHNQDGEKVKIGGRTNNATIPHGLLRRLESTFTQELFEKAGLDFSLVLFGEGYGQKIQNGGKYKDTQDFVLFDVLVDDTWWLSRDNVDDIANKLGIDSVPVIGEGTLHDAVDIVSSGITFNSGGGVVRWGRGGLQSQWGEFEAEGIVARPKVAMFDRKGNRIICKIKGKDFK